MTGSLHKSALKFSLIATAVAAVISSLGMGIFVRKAGGDITYIVLIASASAFIVSYAVWRLIMRPSASQARGGLCGLISAVLIYFIFSLSLGFLFSNIFEAFSASKPSIDLRAIIDFAVVAMLYAVLITGAFAFPIAFIVGYTVAKPLAADPQ